ncbi:MULTISPECIES: hypothetical protein [Acinetobacter]|uniref:Uncharacterized protein n=1 Tax=Acinetobacter piscicola TaxID=2006115 RepID=A0A7S6VT27_9GAMM|nr:MULTISPECIES: hypothetical protein [Acinetobacter]QOW44423.1 hypothetical protein G0028_11480 [Acinetobacter piscicola]
MRLGRFGLGFVTAMMGFSASFQGFTDSFKRLSAPHIWTKPPSYKSKPNRVSQAKCRKYKRQGR